MAAAFFTGSVIIGNVTGNMAEDHNDNDADDKQDGKNGFDYFFHFFLFLRLGGFRSLTVSILYHKPGCLSRGFAKVLEIFLPGRRLIIQPSFL